MSSITLDSVHAFGCTTIPPNLWRVQHNESRASFERNGDLVAALSNYIGGNESTFRNHLTMHLRWGYSKVESPFLSVFGDREEAMRWARARQDWLDKQTSVYASVKLFQINCCSLRQSVVFRVDDLLARLDISLDRDTSHEYLILHRIPANAIRLDVDISDMVFQGKRVLRCSRRMV